MLSNFRAFAQSPYAIVIILLLVLGFALYGVGGIFTGSGTAVVVIGDEQISQRELARSYERELQRIQDENPDFTREQAQAAGIGDQVLQQLITQAAFYDAASRLGLAISDRALTTELSSYDAFRNPVTGALDREAYISALRNARLIPTEFEASLQEDLTRGQLIDAVVSGSGVPRELAATRFLVREEQRRIRALILAPAGADEIEAATDEQLQAFIDGNPSQVDELGLPVFVAPEFRAITLMRFQLEDFIADVEVDEDDLRATYDYQVENAVIGSPAQRSFIYLNAGDEAAANAIATRLAAGETPAAIATDLAIPPPLTQSDVQAYQVPDVQLASAVFAMPSGDTAAVQGSFGWYAVKVNAAIDAVTPTYESQLPELRTEAARAEALNLMFEKMAEFEQARADGASLEVAAQTAGMPLESFIPLDRYARDDSGEIDFERYASLGPDILTTAFDQFAGFAIDIRQYNETDWFTLRVDEIIPTRPRELAEVRDQAQQIWLASQRDIQLQARADEALAQLRAGDDMEFVVLTAGGRIETSTLKRDETAGTFTRNVVGQAFGLDIGTPELLRRQASEPHMIIIVDEIIPSDVSRAGIGAVEQLDTTVRSQINDDILAATQSALLTAYGIDGASIDQRLRAEALGETGIQ